MEEALPPNPGEMRFGKLDDIKARVAAAIDASRKYLFSLQHAEEGYWCGELGADTTLESDYIRLHRLLGTESAERTQKCANEILSHQNEDGGWPIFNGGPSNISASVKAYFALKMAGYTPEHPALVKARDRILAMGGVTQVNTFTKIYLCFLGQYDYDSVPAIPPEIVLFPNWFWFNIYEISSWSRAILVPLSIAYAKKPFKKIPDEQGIEELFVGGRSKANLRLHWAEKLVSWRNFFLVLDRMVHFLEKVHIRPLRSQAIKKAEQWMLERLEVGEGLGAIFALGGSGVSPTDPRMVQPSEWMLRKQVTRKGDWCVKNKKAAPAGWYFEFNNEFYPDVDDSALVLLALSKVKTSNESYHDKSVQRAIDWILSMQCKNGGWASFDKDNDKMVFQNIPFADHNAMLDPATVDITGRVLECLATYGYSMKDQPVRRAVEYLKREQEPDGSWFGRWGVNYIYGTALVLRGLEAVGMDYHEPCVQQAAEWLRMMQNPDGGWGETCGSYDDPNIKGVGPSTASQTAWAVMGLLAANDTRSDSLQRGVAYLLKTQRRDGSWDEQWYTGTGFPRVFYLMYYMYRLYFPLIALSAYAKTSAAAAEEQFRAVRLRTDAMNGERP